MIFFKSHSCPYHIKKWYVLEIVHFKAYLILMLMGSMMHIFSFQTSSDGVWQPSFKSQCSSWEAACNDFTVGITKKQTVQKQYYSQVAESQTKHRSRLRSWPRLHYVNSHFCYSLMPRMVTCIWIMLSLISTGRFAILRSFMVFLSSFIHLQTQYSN